MIIIIRKWTDHWKSKKFVNKYKFEDDGTYVTYFTLQ